MIFTELSKDEFRDFLDQHQLRSYLQTPEIASLKVSSGWEEYYVGVKENNKILCATMMIAYKGKLGKKFSAPRGYLIDFKDKNLLKFFTEKLKKYIKSKGGYVLNIEPKILYKERDINGCLVEGGFNNEEIYQNLLDLGYKHGGFYDTLDLSKQVRWAFVLSLKDKSEEQVFSGFKPNTRNVIRKALKYGVTVRELNYDELDKFVDIVESSGSRKNFHSRELSYFQNMYNLFHDKKEVKFLVSELNIDDYVKVLLEENEELENKLAQLSDSGSNKGKKQEFSQKIKAIKSRVEEAKELKKAHGNVVIMAGAMFMLYGTEIIYLFSGTKTEFLTLKSQYLLQWHIIQYGLKHNFEIHNFYGINGKLDKSDDRYGVYEFKRSFGGNVIEYIGDFDLIINKPKYCINKIINKVIS